MQIKTKHLKKFLDELRFKPSVDLEELTTTIQAYSAQEDRSEFISNTIQGIVKHNSLFGRPGLSVDLLKQMGPEHYFKEIIPKVFF